MKTIKGFVLVTMVVGLGCGSSALKQGTSGGKTSGGQGGSTGSVANGGHSEASGAAGTAGNTGLASGGQGGSGRASAGGTGGTSGTVCPGTYGVCPTILCLGGVLGKDACGCPQCAPLDGGVVKDAAPDACLMVATCDVLPSCPAGQRRMARPCACPVCVPDDAGQPDAPLCPSSCPAFQCPYGSVRDPVCGCWTCIEPDAGVGKDVAPGQDASPDVCLHPPCPLIVCPAGTRSVTPECGCPTCEPVDAGADAERMACVGLDECACWRTKGCSAVAESCYCPYPQCGNSGACFCGGGKYFGCEPAQLEECTAAKGRVSKLCPNLSGPTFDGLCKGTDNACVTKCLNEVNACGDISCSMCEACDCASDAFMRCRGTCQKQLGS
jgi:hypothetical protein